MKNLPALLACLALPLLAVAQEAKLAELKTLDGKSYTQVTIRKVEPDVLSIFHESGTAKIAFTNLSPEVQKQFGYEPAKAAEAIKNKNVARYEAWKTLPASQRYSIQPASADNITLAYDDWHTLTTEEKTLATRQALKPEIAAQRVDSIPLGGRVFATIRRSTIGAANTEYFTIIAWDQAGKEVARCRGENNIAEVPNGTGFWWNIISLHLEKDFGRYLRVRVVDALSNSQADFEIRRINDDLPR